MGADGIIACDVIPQFWLEEYVVWLKISELNSSLLRENEYNCTSGLWLGGSEELYTYWVMIGVASTSETSVNVYHTTRRKNPEDSHIQ
jgi:hypothetical protein